MNSISDVVCGVEMPIRFNPFLPLFDLSTYLDTDNVIGVPGLYRYSFVYRVDPDSEISETETRVVSSLIRANGPAHWICVWDRTSSSRSGNPKVPVVLRWNEEVAHERREQGWHICPKPGEPEDTDITLAIATIPASAEDVLGFGPSSYHKLLGGTNRSVKRRLILALGIEQEVCNLVKEVLYPEMRHMNMSGGFMPSQPLLQWLADTTLGLASVTEVSSVKQGVVVLRSVPFSAESLKELGVTEVRSGDLAQTVWKP